MTELRGDLRMGGFRVQVSMWLDYTMRKKR